MKSLYQKKVKKRITILIFFLIIWIASILFRLIQLQIIDHSQLKAEVIDQNQNTEPIFPKRGTIYDRSGSILARSVPRQSVFYTSFKTESSQLQLERIKKLKGILELSERELRTIKTRIEKNDSFIWIKRKIDLAKSDEVEKLNLSGIHLEEESKRFYPQGKLASHLIGKVNIDDVGASGIEYKYDSVLGGERGKRIILRDAKRRKYQFEILKEPIPGKDLILTIDETIQYIAEKELEKAVLKFSAIGGSVIISQPATGEILAMANYPTFNSNSPPSFIRNRAIHHTFDPGSTFKFITASAAIESSSVSFNEVFDCSEGSFPIAGKTIRDWKKFSLLSFPEVIIHSSNVGTIQVGMRVGEENLYQTIKEFGFGQKTGIDLPGEEKGIFIPLNRWTEISIASLSIGYEISVTAIQMLQAINIIANRGNLISPKLIKKILISTEETEEIRSETKRVISEETAFKLAYILQKAVQDGTGKSAQIQDYNVAGKTGTAQKFDPSIKAYSSRSHIASYAGFVYDDDPIFSMIVVIDDPKDQYYGAQVAAPVFQKIGTQILQYNYLSAQKNYQESSLPVQVQDEGGRQK